VQAGTACTVNADTWPATSLGRTPPYDGEVQVTATDRAAAVVERAKRERSGELTITIGTGCCESTAPFLYEDFWPGPDQGLVGEIVGVPVYAPEYLRAMYPGDDGAVIDVFDGPAESMSIETEWDCRLFLRGQDVDRGEELSCVVDTGEPGLLADRELGTFATGEMPAELKRLRMR
jgi:uncharacterized protein (DUF779 family)